MGQQGKPANLPKMKTLAHAINSVTGNSSTRNPTLTNQHPTKTTSSSRSPKRNLRLLPVIPPSGILLFLPTKPSASSTSISDKLGKDSKLSAKEHQRCFDNNLCLYCGVTGHKTADCKKVATSTSKAKTHTAVVKEKEKEEPPKKAKQPLASAQPEGCITLSCAAMEAVHLNTSALFDSSSLHVLLTSTSVPDSIITTLIDSRSTHCFVDSKFACTHDLPLTSVPLIQLRLFDGTSNGTITQSFQFPVTFDSGETMTVNMFVTPLDSSCSVVLGYNWLTCYNPSINWVLGSIKFYPHLLESLTLSPMSSAKKAQLPLQNPTTSETLPILATLNPPSVPPHIALICAAAFALASKQPSVQSFRIHLSDPLFSAKSASASD